MKKKVILLVMLMFLVFTGINVAAINENFEIENYDININVREDNSYEVTETIQVKFNLERHGIIRNIPLKTNTGQNAKITKASVENQEYEIYKESGDFKIKIGDPDSYANTNEIYKISYIYHMGNDAIEGFDEFYFNLIGLEWDVNIKNITFDITMPKEFDTSKVNFTYGKSGSTENSGINYKIEGNRIIGNLNNNLGPQEALTVALPLPEGYFIKKNPVIGPFLQNHYEIFYIMTALIGILLWIFFGKNRRIFPTVEFNPPTGLTPADVGYIYDGVVNPKDITSLIIYWADKGYLEIEEKGKQKGIFGKRKKPDILLRKLKNLDSNAKEYEVRMFEDLFKNKTVEINHLKYKFYSTINSVKNSLLRLWQRDKENRIYSAAGKPLAVLIHLFSFITAVGVGYGVCYSHEQTFFGDIIIFALIIGIIMVFPIIKISGLIVNWKQFSIKIRVKRLVKYSFLLGLTAGFGMWKMSWDIRTMIISGYITCFIISIFAANSTRRTKIGDQYMEKIIGFKDFILHAEKDKINMMLEDNPKYYFNVLPYALVLGITDKWAKKFENITLEPPEWYKYNDMDRNFDTLEFTEIMVANTAIMANTLSSGAPTSSGGSDGGGSWSGGESGGGSGGGGGDDW